MKYLGLDLSLRSTGWCIIKVIDRNPRVFRYGVIQPKKLRDIERLVFIESVVRRICLTWKIQGVGLEGYAFFSRTGKAMDRGELGGIIKRYFHEAGIPVNIIAPKSIKKFVTGNGNSDKKQMVEVVLANSGCSFQRITRGRLNDVADAYGVAYMSIAKAGHIDVASWRQEMLEV